MNHFEKNQWEIPDVASALGITEQYLRKILNNPEKQTNDRYYCLLQNQIGGVKMEKKVTLIVEEGNKTSCEKFL